MPHEDMYNETGISPNVENSDFSMYNIRNVTTMTQDQYNRFYSVVDYLTTHPSDILMLEDKLKLGSNIDIEESMYVISLLLEVLKKQGVIKTPAVDNEGGFDDSLLYAVAWPDWLVPQSGSIETPESPNPKPGNIITWNLIRHEPGSRDNKPFTGVRPPKPRLAEHMYVANPLADAFYKKQFEDMIVVVLSYMNTDTMTPVSLRNGIEATILNTVFRSSTTSEQELIEKMMNNLSNHVKSGSRHNDAKPWLDLFRSGMNDCIAFLRSAHKDQKLYIAVYSQWWDSIVQFDCFAKSNAEAMTLAKNFRRLIVQYRGFFESFGINHIHPISVRQDPTIRNQSLLPSMSVRFYIRTEEFMLEPRISIRELKLQVFDEFRARLAGEVVIGPHRPIFIPNPDAPTPNQDFGPGFPLGSDVVS